MSILDNSEKLMILISISDKLWDDYQSGDICEDEYLSKSDDVRREIMIANDLSFKDLQLFTSKIGYVLIQKKNAFSTINNYKIAAN
ncbi:hypothetical protein KBP46_10155 [Chryseobacterium sp. PCH239]|uniref:hypothetical protein n=1 Tax=Chryseobacterium sp. PCH239 TaxID=2825845 RepID=UPI001C11BC2C|nr:hypothetical protein [Chryseobacterium sp. PCH239]QWT88159.1 hypothetical protein KBP46_10155 [Chryseobacterium sp. PCH239]